MAVDTLRQAMHRYGLDALIASSPENVLYVSGVRLLVQRLIPERIAHVVIFADGVSTLITVESDADHAKREASVTRVVGHGHVEPSALAVATVLRDGGAARGRVGFEATFLPVWDHQLLQREMPQVQFLPADDIFRQARMRKTDQEIALLEIAQRRTELAMIAAMAMSGIGDREVDVATRIAGNMVSAGAQTVDFVLLSAGVNSTVYHLPPGEYRIRSGDVVHLDIGGSFANYRSDLSRNVGYGAITARQRDVYARLWDVQRAIIERMRPGVRVGELIHVYEAEMERAGLQPPSLHLGHGIGLGSHEHPELTPAAAAVELAEGMVLAIEPTTFIAGDARYDIEDTVVVTADGSRMLSGNQHSRQLWVL